MTTGSTTQQGEATVSNALDGFRVIDLSNGLAGNSCTKLLADLGAEVIKLENPGRGDFTRTLVPWVFETFNRNKRSFAVDLRRAEGRDLALRLIRTADVFIQTLHPDAAESMGLGRGAVTACNPRIIHVSLSAFGATGPSSRRKAVDVVIQAESGLSTIQGQIMTNGSFIDATAGLHLLSGILSALMKRERTGEVDHVTVNLLDAALYMESVPFAEFSVTGSVIDPRAYVRRFPTVSVLAVQSSSPTSASPPRRAARRTSRSCGPNSPPRSEAGRGRTGSTTSMSATSWPGRSTALLTSSATSRSGSTTHSSGCASATVARPPSSARPSGSVSNGSSRRRPPISAPIPTRCCPNSG